MQLHNCYCGNLVFLCIKGSLTSSTLCQVWCMNVDFILSNQTTFYSSWYSGKWHAIFKICWSLDSYFILFITGDVCWFVIGSKREISNHSSYSFSNHVSTMWNRMWLSHAWNGHMRATTNQQLIKKMNAYMYCTVEIDILTMTWPILALSPTTCHLVSIWSAIELRFICN